MTFLTAYWTRVYGSFVGVEGGRCPLFAGSLRPEFLEIHLRSCGWCFNKIERFSKSLSAVALYYANLLPVPAHEPLHINCTRNVYHASNIDENNYVTAHGLHCSGCDLVAVKQLELTRILKKSTFPVIEITLQEQVPLLRIVPQEAEIRYVAISHVWSQGLGNPYDTALPSCQLRKIACYINAALDIGVDGKSATRHVWIDTLCVPVHWESGRNQAILKMKDSYREAEAVLVLDSNNLAQPVPCNFEQTLLTLFSSAWTTRLWTSQEACLARKLLFQFADGVVNLVDVLGQISQALEWECRLLIGGRAAQVFERMLDVRRQIRRDQKSSLNTLWKMIGWRSTSKKETFQFTLPHSSAAI